MVAAFPAAQPVAEFIRINCRDSSMLDQAEKLRRELEDAFQNRAHLYRLLLDELEQDVGVEQAQTLMTRALERRGREVAQILFRDMPPDPRAIGARFLSVSPDEGRMYPHDVEGTDDCVTIRVHRCPLKDAWFASRLSSERIATLCRVAGAFDKGLFEAAGLAFSNETWTEERGGGCCWITLERNSHSGDA
jgi:L-2-amino-thiazoline-4-carboxylic acid hydrolase